MTHSTTIALPFSLLVCFSTSGRRKEVTISATSSLLSSSLRLCVYACNGHWFEHINRTSIKSCHFMLALSGSLITFDYLQSLVNSLANSIYARMHGCYREQALCVAGTEMEACNRVKAVLSAQIVLKLTDVLCLAARCLDVCKECQASVQCGLTSKKMQEAELQLSCKNPKQEVHPSLQLLPNNAGRWRAPLGAQHTWQHTEYLFKCSCACSYTNIHWPQAIHQLRM